MTCRLSAIVAVSDDWGIGYEGDMIVSNRADMRHFVELTTGHPVIMGRKTLDSFPGGRPLRNRRNIVLTRDGSFAREGVEVVHSVEEALAAVAGEPEAWVIGGAEIYRAMLPLCDEAHVTRTHCLRLADTYFPNLDDDDDWSVVDESETMTIAPEEEDHGIEFRFVTYRRRGAEGPEADADEAASAAAPVSAGEAADGAAEHFHLKTMILYRSKHHGNTRKLVEAVAAAFPGDIDTLDVATLGKDKRVDLSDYALVGVASGIYYGNIDRELKLVMEHSLEQGYFVFALLTYGGQSKWYGKDIDATCRLRRATFLAGHGCPGFDTWGPYRLMGGMNKGRPNDGDIAECIAWLRELVDGYGPAIQNELVKRRRRVAWDAEHPDPTIAEKLRNTGRSLFRRRK